MSWLPRKLSPHVRCVFSLIQDSIQHQTLVKRETKPIEIKLPPLDLESRKVNRKSQHAEKFLFSLFWKNMAVLIKCAYKRKTALEYLF